MKAYIGHYVGAPHSWFFITANSPEEAIDFIDCEWGEPDARSLKEVKGPIAFQFVARLEEDEEGEDVVEYEPDTDDSTLSLGEGAGYWDASDWVKERLRTPFGLPGEDDFRAMDAVLGKEMPEAWKESIASAGERPNHDKVRE
jgi:hypothetical protein